MSAGILYLHGFCSSPESWKARLLGDAMRARGQGALEPRPGMLVSLRGVHLAVNRVDTLSGTLHVHAQCLIADESGAQYTFRIEHAGVEVASGRAAVIHPKV